MAEHHTLMGGKLHVYRRETGGTNWHCAAYVAGKNWRVSTKEDSLSHAKDFAEDWYLGLRGKARNGELKIGKTFAFAAEQFIREFNVITYGERSAKYVQLQEERIRGHLMSFFGSKVVTEITPGLVQEYRLHRMTKPKKVEEREKRDAEEAKEKRANGEEVKLRKPWTPPARSTLHQEVIALRHVLRTANRHGWLPYLPDISAPYKASGKISHRAWFSPKEYQDLYEATRDRVDHPRHKQKWRWESAQLHDFVLFMVNTGLRPDEAKNLEFRDVEIVDEPTSKEEILEISVRGKRGVGYCKSMNGAVEPFRRLQARTRPAKFLSAGVNGERPTEGRLPAPTDRLFPNEHRELLNKVLNELGLKTDREGQVRSAYSLRHTYICLRLMQGADIYQIAKNCRTSVEMIEKFYASHIKDLIDAAAVNVMKPKPKPKGEAKAKRTNVRAPQRKANAKGARTRRSGGYPKSRR